MPLAPSYRILKASYEVQFVAGPPCQLAIHLIYKLQNNGNSNLALLEAKFPDEKEFGRKDLHVEMDGGSRSPTPLVPVSETSSSSNTLRISLDSPWTQGQVRTLEIKYTFASPENSGALITLGEDEFHLGSGGWLPELQPPKHLLASHPQPPALATYTLRVPADFIVLARGIPKGQSTEGGDVKHRFELGKGVGPPFIVAGRYVSTPPNRRSHSAVFWTLAPFPNDPSSGVEPITLAWKTLETAFGPLDKNIVAPHIVESPELRAPVGKASEVAVAFPGGAIANPAAFALGTRNDAFLNVVTLALARNWFGEEIRPGPGTSIGIGEGLPEYATIVVEEARKGAAGRRRRILEYLRRYNEARTRAAETPLGMTTLTDPIGPRQIALAKAPLFYVTLEDICGELEVRKGLARLVALLSGQQVDYSDLRAALEQSTHQNLGSMFRIWLNDKGLPQDFLDRYPLGIANEETGW